MFKLPILNEILEKEIAAGNKISEVTDWPPKCKKLVILEYSFKENYATEGLTYKVVNDPHYWYAEYMAQDGSECLACRYL